MGLQLRRARRPSLQHGARGSARRPGWPGARRWRPCELVTTRTAYAVVARASRRPARPTLPGDEIGGEQHQLRTRDFAEALASDWYSARRAGNRCVAGAAIPAWPAGRRRPSGLGAGSARGEAVGQQGREAGLSAGRAIFRPAPGEGRCERAAWPTRSARAITGAGVSVAATDATSRTCALFQ